MKKRILTIVLGIICLHSAAIGERVWVGAELFYSILDQDAAQYVVVGMGEGEEDATTVLVSAPAHLVDTDEGEVVYAMQDADGFNSLYRINNGNSERIEDWGSFRCETTHILAIRNGKVYYADAQKSRVFVRDKQGEEGIVYLPEGGMTDLNSISVAANGDMVCCDGDNLWLVTGEGKTSCLITEKDLEGNNPEGMIYPELSKPAARVSERIVLFIVKYSQESNPIGKHSWLYQYDLESGQIAPFLDLEGEPVVLRETLAYGRMYYVANRNAVMFMTGDASYDVWHHIPGAFDEIVVISLADGATRTMGSLGEVGLGMSDYTYRNYVGFFDVGLYLE